MINSSLVKITYSSKKSRFDQKIRVYLHFFYACDGKWSNMISACNGISVYMTWKWPEYGRFIVYMTAPSCLGVYSIYMSKAEKIVASFSGERVRFVFISPNGTDRSNLRFSYSTPPILGRSNWVKFDQIWQFDRRLTTHCGHHRDSHHSLFRILRGAGFLMGSDTIWVSPKKSLHFFRREGSTSIVCSHFHSVPFLPDAMMMMKVVHWW